MRSTSPFSELRRYFLDGFLRPSFLGEHGADALRRLIVTMLSLTAMLGLFLPYPLLKKYWYLSGLDSGVPYREALLSDQTLVLGVPMIIIGLVMSLVAPSLYVDDADFVVLTPLPVTSATVFAAKLAAVVTFVGLFVVAANTFGNLWFPAISGGRWATHSGPARLGAHTLASVLATSFVPIVLAVLQGMTVTMLPRHLATSVSTTLQALLLCALTAAIPLLLRMPGLLQVQPWMTFAPPCWFVGLAHYVLGDRDPAMMRLATIAVIAYGVAVAALVACYAAAYLQYGKSKPSSTFPQTFPQSARSFQGSDPIRADRAHDPNRWGPAPGDRAQRWLTKRMGRVTLAGFAFIRATVFRSPLNLLVFAGVVAMGIGLVVDTMLTSTVGSRYRIELPSREVSYRAIAPSLVLVLTMLVGLRATFLLPVNRDANWIFRLIDGESTRIGLLASVEMWFVVVSVGVPLLVGLPIQLVALGLVRTALSAPLVLLIALTMVEVVLRTWRRVPFTCSYIPGKEHLAKVIVFACFAYWLFVYRAGHIVAWAILRPSRWLMILGLLLATWAALRRRRLASPERASLEFEDEMPDVIRSLGLSS